MDLSAKHLKAFNTALAVVRGATIAKRSLSALARTSQLPHSSTSPVDQAGHDQDHGHGGHSPGQHDKRAELQEEAIREELLRQRAAPASEAFLSAIMAADQYGSDLNGVEDKRSVSSLARHGNLPASAMEDMGKRSLSSLARYGNLPASAMEEASKRSLSSLARYGNLPASAMEEASKRSLSSLARYGNLPASAMEDASKRSLSSLARYGNLPAAPADQQEKRSLASLARYGNLPAGAAPPAPADKRSLEALARGGLLTKNSRIDSGSSSNNNNNKRSLSSLARLGELPKRWMPPHQREQAQDLLDTMQRELDDNKRGVSSLARSGHLSRAASLYDDLEKRSIESLARTWSLPERVYGYGPYEEEDYEHDAWGKRNAAALLRQTHFSSQGNADDAQRDDVDQHGQGRRKRSLWDDDLMSGEVAPPYVQSTSGQEQDWETMWSPTAWGAYLGYGYGDDSGAPLQKRFLGRIPNMGRHRQKTNEDSSPRRRRPH
ncbi:Neuropeptide-like 1 [Frankliniella fusca]|uniref:Neuropeptide-like 1 n=1 Tax=Frankliniella fusca TaxID=407009 RepID=A0AAE1HV07_9NEOP|nr:Neuropeptide-like 1 [Frankliniella fusca]